MTERALPRLARLLLVVLVPRRWRDSIAGDLLEERARRRVAGRSTGAAWCAVQAIRIAGPLYLAEGTAWVARHLARVRPWRGLGQDLRYGSRRIVRKPGVPILVMATLGIGVGANAAMFDLVDRLMFRPPEHVRDPDRVVSVGIRNFVRYLDVSSRSTTLDVAVYADQSLSLGLGADAIAIDTECVTATYFPVLGVAPVLGRTFTSDDEAAGAPLSIVLSHGLWQRQFGADPSVVGRSIQVAGRSYTVIGVMPRGVRSPRGGPIDAWIPLVMSPDVCSFTGTNLLASAGGSWLGGVGRIWEGFSLPQVRAELSALGSEGAEGPPSAVSVQPLIESRRDRSTADGRLAMWLAGGAAVLLLLACANVAGLLSLRAIDRRREMSLRIQLGATRWRVYRQLLTEHALLVAGGGAVAVAVASGVSISLDSVFPTGASGSGLGARGTVLLAASAILAGLLSTVLPALQASPLGRTTGWRAGSGVTTDRTLLRSTLLVAQLALALVLVVGAGLFVRSVEFVKRDLGYDLERVLVATLDLQRAGIRREVQMREAFDSMLSAVQRLPDVEAASLTTAVPLGFGRSYTVTHDRENVRNPVYASVSPEYFATLATRLEEGRVFTADDTAASLPVMIVDRALARALRPDGDALGHCLEVGRGRPCVHIIGISESRRFTQLTRPDGEAFLPLAQTPGRETIPQALLIRVRTSPAEALSQVRVAIQSASDNLPVAEIRRLEDLVNVRARSWRVGATVFSLFGTMAMALAALGIYGAVAFSVRQRRPEIGVRMALGASPRDILVLFLRRVIVIVAIGWTAGIAAASLASGAIEGLLYGVTAADPRTYVITSAILIGAGLAGCIVPAVRATQVNPSVTVREETA